MHGNVLEWCNDWYGNYSSTPQTNPTGPSNGSFKIARGGIWFYNARDCRSAARDRYAPDSEGLNVGFRVGFNQ